MSSSAATSRSVRMTSRNPPVTRVKESSGSQIVSVGDARDRAAGTAPQVQPAPAAGQLVHVERTDAIPSGSGGDDIEFDQEALEKALAGDAGVDALVSSRGSRPVWRCPCRTVQPTSHRCPKPRNEGQERSRWLSREGARGAPGLH